MSFFSYAFAFVLMLSVLIFVHELGHFLVAKWCGVRVLKFSLGFGPTISFGRHRMQWKRGHTEYVVAWLPLGGFVKMLGENLDETQDPEVLAHPSETLGSKPTWQKLAIVFAGPAMNLFLPVVVFVATLAVGLTQPAPVIGTVEAGSPAAAAGLEPGDTIVSVGGEAVAWWRDFADAVRERPDATLAVGIERDGARSELLLHVSQRSGLDEFGKVRTVGWVGAGHSRHKAVLGIPQEVAPAAQAGLRSGDLVTSLAGEEIEDWTHFARLYEAAAPGAELEIEVSRGRGEEAVQTTRRIPALGDLAAFGIVPATVLVAVVSPDSPAMRGGLEAADLILSVDGESVGSFSSFAEIVRTSGGRTLEIGFARDGRTFSASIAPELLPVDVGLGIEEPRYLVGITAEAATLVGALELDQEVNPLVSVPRAVGMTVDVTATFLQGLLKLISGEVSRKQLAGPIGIAEIAGRALERGWDTYLSIMVLISINLGILNLLPIPILDGGQAVIFAVEGIKRGPLSLRTREIFQQIGLAVLVLLMGMAFWNDLSRQWTRLVD